jgi:phosphonate transport system ATP-binding protein
VTNSVGLLDLAKATVRFGDHTVLREVNVHVEPGECVAIVGPSGAGKSTLLRVCTANVALDSGDAMFLGLPIADTNQWRSNFGSQIATVHQQLHLSNRLKVVHNVNAGRLGQWSTWRALTSLIRARETNEVRAILETLGISEKINMRTDLLSGGEQQRVAIARALRQKPKLILADEPTASLDPARAEEIMTLLADVAQQSGHALVVSQHDAALARRHCARIIGIRNGSIEFDAPSVAVSDAMLQSLYAIEHHEHQASGGLADTHA